MSPCRSQENACLGHLVEQGDDGEVQRAPRSSGGAARPPGRRYRARSPRGSRKSVSEAGARTARHNPPRPRPGAAADPVRRWMVEQPVMRLNDVAGIGVEILARGSQPRVPTAPVQQPDTQLGLKGADPQRHRSPGASEHFRCGRKAPFRGDRNERPQELRVDIRHPYRLYRYIETVNLCHGIVWPQRLPTARRTAGPPPAPAATCAKRGGRRLPRVHLPE